MSAEVREPLTRGHSWTFIVPVANLWLTDEVGREFRVDRVTFVDKDKLPRVRKRLGLSAPVSDVKKRLRRWNFFESANAFAVVRHGGAREEAERRSLEMVREELSILSLSQLGYSNRRQMRPIVPAGESANLYFSFLAVSDRSSSWFGSRGRRTGPVGDVILGGRWKSFANDVFFANLLKILQGETEVETGWRRELRRASVMIGESVGANDLLKSFVWNMVALETLLTAQEGGLRDTLPRRAEALLGWVVHWEVEDYEGRIRTVYGKRNALLHSGKRDGITEQDLAFTDHLLLNLLINLVCNTRLFRSKADVVEFSRRVEAERVLGVKPKVRPSNLMFVRRVRPDF